MSYDATSEPNEFVADSREEAVAKAASFYGVSESELRIAEPQGVFNAGARVVLVAVPKELKGRPARGGRDRDRPSRDRDRDRDRGDRGERGGRRERGGRGRRGGRDSEPEPEAAAPPEPVESKGTATGDLSSAGEYVLGAVERMGLGNFEVTETEEDDFIVIQLEGQAADALGAQDRALGALQLLVNQAATMSTDEEAKRIVVDCDSDPEQRQSFLERTAGRAAKRAKETSRSVALDPMNGRDRRALHVAVRDIDGVVTMSVGTGRYRQVVIVPEGAPEYAEASAAAREAEDRDRDR